MKSLAVLTLFAAMCIGCTEEADACGGGGNVFSFAQPQVYGYQQQFVQPVYAQQFVQPQYQVQQFGYQQQFVQQPVVFQQRVVRQKFVQPVVVQQRFRQRAFIGGGGAAVIVPRRGVVGRTLDNVFGPRVLVVQ